MSETKTTAAASAGSALMRTSTALMRTSTDEPIDKSQWPRGPWDDEPDLLEWQSATPPHYWCQIARNPMWGTLNGYVAVPLGHPAHGWNTQRCCELEVHGEVTWAGPGVGDLWVIGFDCGHGFDLQPGIEGLFSRMTRLQLSPAMPWGSVYRDLPYVRSEVESLARQLAGLVPSLPEGQP